MQRRYFNKMLGNVTKQKRDSVMVKKILDHIFYCQQVTYEQVDYQYFTHSVRELTSADFVFLNLIAEDNDSKVITKAVSGDDRKMTALFNQLDFQLLGSAWHINPKQLHLCGENTLHRIFSFSEMGCHAHHSEQVSKVEQLEKSFGNSNLYAMELNCKGNSLGFMIIVMPEGKLLTNKEMVELYINQIAATIQRLRSENDLKQKFEEQELLLDNIQTQIWYLYEVDKYGAVNKAHAEFLGFSKGEAKNRNIYELLHELEAEKCIASNREVFDKKCQIKTEEYAKNARGELRLLSITKTPKLDENEKVKYVVCNAHDITEQKSSENQLSEQKEWSEALFKNSSDAIVQLDNQFRILQINDNFTTLFGYQSHEVMGVKLDEIILNQARIEDNDNFDNSVQSYQNPKTKILEAILKGESIIREDTRYNKFGEKLEVIIKGVPVITNNQVVGGYVVYTDITERKRAEDRIRYLSFHDSLTGLYNRAYIENEMERLDTARQLPISIIMADVNGLKLINDTYGHEEGDRLLKGAANILKEESRHEDLVARWGGDEFLMLLPQTDKESAQKIMDRIKSACQCSKLDYAIIVNIALGVSTKEQATESLQEVFKLAEDNMYKSKLTESSSARGDIISTMLSTLQERTDESEEHAWRMTALSFRVGKAYGLSDEELDRLTLLATVHDIGKLVLSKEIFTKNDELTKEEWTKIKEHPEIGKRIARSTENLVHVSEEIGAHHERWDGKGYPLGIKGEAIPLLARIIAIIDAYDVMVNGRIYKKAISEEAALAEIKNQAGYQFDPNLVELFVEVVQT